MFGWEFPPHITGGLGTACYGITKGLAKQNIEILFVVPKAHGNEDQSYATVQDAGKISIKFNKSIIEDYWKNVTFKEVFSKLIPYLSPEEYEKRITEFYYNQIHQSQTGTTKGFEFSGKYGVNLWEEIYRYSMVTSVLASEKNFDIIHAHDWLTFPAAMKAKEISAKPLIVHVHATEFDRSGENINQAVYDIEKRGMEAADKIFTVSNYTKNLVTGRYGIPASKVTTIYNAVDESYENPVHIQSRPTKEKIVSFLGRITYQKGPEYFVEAAHKVLQKTKNVRFVIAGSGDMSNKIVRQVARLGISTKLNFAGFLKGEEVKRLFSMTDVYVMPSVSEPFGIAPLEALQLKVPVIISKQSGVSEVLKHAIKVDFWDINALSEAIYGMLEYRSLSTMAGKNGKDEVSKMKWEDVGAKISDVYDSIVQKN